MNIKSLAAVSLFCLLSGQGYSEESLPEARGVKPDPLMESRVSNIIGVNHVGMTVRDIDSSVQFYKETVGLTLVRHLPSAVVDGMPELGNKEGDVGKAAVVQGPNSFLRLMEFDHGLPAHKDGVLPSVGPGITHICFQAPKARPVDRRFIENGGSWVSTGKAMVDMRGVGFMYGYLRDPDGLMIEIEHAPEPKFQGDVWMSHVAIATTDMTRALDFYGKVLGYPHYRRVDNIGGPTFDLVVDVENSDMNAAWFRIANYYNLEFWQFNEPASEAREAPASINQRGYNMFVLETTDIEADFQRIRAAGVVLETEIVETVDGRAFYLRDPDGNLLALTQINKGSSLSLNALEANSRR